MTLKDDITAQINAKPAQDTNMMHDIPDTSVITVACPPDHYCASAIAHAVEDCDAHLLDLHITADSDTEGRLFTQLRFDHRDPSAVARSLERYGYEVTDFSVVASDSEMSQMRDRVNELLHYLEI